MHAAIWIIAAVGLFVAAVSAPIWLGRVSPNRLYGFRTPRLVADERAWYPANKIMGRNLVAAGIVMAVAALALGAMTPAGVEPGIVGVLSVVLMPLLVAMGHGTYAASAIVAELDGIAPPQTSALDKKKKAAAATQHSSQRHS